ncbi:Zn(2)-C6 fungal-type domain-containing protein [Mycena sanguinolenta]|uniref:Zn(2)-C6 fungal-type domain-containing protein n=1 Tax=Mycena sanguinolenta TaxID=230812 RepID=A0A8H6ZIB6_9AGAR|nr:Zn(2)-C6 fungal-type domain-containing protein [Mycena sanguinolenta]
MPVDKSKPLRTNSKRLQDSDYISQSIPGASGLTHARELEVKRSRGEVSCAECRRLKIKCDKQIPCQSCVRRGCSALCPNGALATGQGTRFVLAATEHLHRKIARMGERIRMLEDALTTLHASKGGADGAVHPLLVDGEDFTAGVDDPQPPNSTRRMGEPWEVLDGPSDGKTPGANPDVIDAFGTLSISDHGISRFFGPTGGSESLLIANLPGTPSTSNSASPSSLSLSLSRSSQSLSPPSTHASAPESPARRNPPTFQCHSPYAASPSDSPGTLFSSSAFPLTPIGSPQAIHALVTSHLPRLIHARKLVQCYFEQVAWLFRGVTRGQVGDMLRAVYTAYAPRHSSHSPDGSKDDVQLTDEEGDGEDEDYTGPHDLALLFLVFATGALVQPPAPGCDEDDVHRQKVAAEAEHLHQIARAALALQPVLEKPSLVTIQTLHLLSIYTTLGSPPAAHSRSKGEDEGETSMEMTWSLITLAAHLSQTIGLHRDSARWGLSPTMVQRRRILFWDLFTADVWNSLNTGRPPSFSLAYIDCSFPTYDDSKAIDGVYELWAFRFAAQCVAEVTARTLTAEAPSYATIMELDRKVREFPLPAFDEGAPDDVGANLQRCVLEHAKETILMYIHRSFFAQAIIEQPTNPLKSTYAPSFLAAYRASATILKSVREQFAATPSACARFWVTWTFAFSAAVVFGTVVTRGPRSPLATAAMTELETACVLFSKAAVYSRRATKALPILIKLSEKARLALAAAQNDPSGGDNSGLLWNMSGVLGPSGLPVKVKQEEPDDELSIFAGRTRFVSGQRSNQQSSQAFPQRPQPHQRVRVRQQQQRTQGPMEDEAPSYGSYDQRQYAAQYPAQQPPLRQRQLSMPSSSSSFHRIHDINGRPAVNVNVNMTWDSREYPQSAHDYVPSDERVRHAPHQQQHQFYAPDGTMPSIPPPPSAPYAWPVDSYGFDAEPQLQHPHHQQPERHPPHQQQHSPYPHPHSQQQYNHGQGMYDENPQHAAAYQAHNAELAQLGLSSRDSRLDERWSTFMEDSGLLEGM